MIYLRIAVEKPTREQIIAYAKKKRFVEVTYTPEIMCFNKKEMNILLHRTAEVTEVDAWNILDNLGSWEKRTSYEVYKEMTNEN